MIKKIQLYLIIFIINAEIAFWESVFCPDKTKCWLTAEWIKENLPSWIIQEESLARVILWYVDFFMPFLGILSFAWLIYAWFLYVTAWINEENEEKAKNIVKFIMIWVVIVFLSYSITSFIIWIKS
jgi:hypothetical protein